MAQRQPKSRPQPSVPGSQTGNPQPSSPVYGDQWGRSGKQHDGRKGQIDRPEAPEPGRKQT